MLVEILVNEIQNGLLFLRQHDRLLYPNTCMAVKCSVSTAERCKENSQVWSAQRDTPGIEKRGVLHPERVQGRSRAPRTLSGCGRSANTLTRGCARFTRLTPGYSPCTPSGCDLPITTFTFSPSGCSTERGIGLILALLILSLLSILAAALLSAVALDTWIGDNYRTETQLLYLTEAGIEDGREALSLGIPQPSTVPFIQNKPLLDTMSREAGRYSVTLLRSSPLMLRSAGSLGTARKTIEVRLSKAGFPTLAQAITLNEDVPIPGLDKQLENPRGVERIVEGILRNATDIYTPGIGEAIGLRAVGSPKDYRVVVINGDCEIGNGAGYGILLVRGELTVLGSFSWNGLVLVIGQGVMRASGIPAASISGALFLTRTRAAERTPANPLGTLLDRRGAVTLDFPSKSLTAEWNVAEMERANERFPYVRTTYREY
jgi:hypothetical protein